MKSLITRWKPELLYPKPDEPVQRAAKFSAVLGTSFPYRPITTLPAGCIWVVRVGSERIHAEAGVALNLTLLPMVMSKNTFLEMASGL